MRSHAATALDPIPDAERTGPDRSRPEDTLAREYLAAARQRDINHLAPSRMAAELAETRRQLGQVLAAADQAEAARRLAGIRAVLAAFDWEYSDRQLALEEVERIATPAL